MFAKEDSRKLRQLFWTSFGRSFPRKWLRYNTGIKGFTFKFHADTRGAAVSLDIESNDSVKNELLYEQLLSLKHILETEYLSGIQFDPAFELENGKRIQRIWLKHDQPFSIHNKDTWNEAFTFFNEKMGNFESFYWEFEDYIKQAVS